MVDKSQSEELVLTAAEIRQEVGARLKKYEGRNLFERFALFMGMAQLLELGLKRLLSHRYGVDLESLENWPSATTM